MIGEFFGIAFSLPRAAGVAFLFLRSGFAFWTARKAIRSGVHEWANERIFRADSPGLFAFHVGLTIFLGVIAVAGAVGMAFDLRVEP